MGGFFSKSGNGRGIFSDTSIEVEKSLFTNEDERGLNCPCSLADGEISPENPSTSCSPATTNIEEITPENFLEFYQYTLTRDFGDPETALGYNSPTGTILTIIDECNSRGCTGIVFCAQYGTISFDGGLSIASNETCPAGESCVVINALTRGNICY